MSGAHNDPKLLYAIPGVNAYHIANGREELLTPAGPQTLSLLMVPTSSPFADLSKTGTAEEDFYLHLHLPPELDLPLPATTQIYHKPPTSYLIPRWDMGPDSGAFTRIEFPSVGSRKGIQEDVDTFETILAQCTAFLERAPPPRDEKPSAPPKAPPSSKRSTKTDLPAYNPADFKPGEAYAQGSVSSHPEGRIVLVDEEDGSIIGELSDHFMVSEDSGVKPGSKDPVEITFPAEGSQTIMVQPAAPEYADMDLHPAYKKSFLVSNASRASRLIVTTSDLVSKALQSQAEGFTKTVKPTSRAVTFTPATHDRIRRINKLTQQAAGLSASTVGSIGKLAQNVGATIAGRKGNNGGTPKGFDKDGNPIETYKPGILNKSLMAFNTVADGIEQAGRNLLTNTQSSVTTMVQHRWGPEAGEVSRNLGGGFKNVGLVYIDVTGVSRRAILKSVAKGMVVGKVAGGGGDIIVGGGDGGAVVLPPGDNHSVHTIDTETSVTAYEGNGKKPLTK